MSDDLRTTELLQRNADVKLGLLVKSSSIEIEFLSLHCKHLPRLFRKVSCRLSKHAGPRIKTEIRAVPTQASPTNPNTAQHHPKTRTRIFLSVFPLLPLLRRGWNQIPAPLRETKNIDPKNTWAWRKNQTCWQPHREEPVVWSWRSCDSPWMTYLPTGYGMGASAGQVEPVLPFL